MTEVKKPIIGVQVEDFTDDVWTGVAGAYVRSAYNLSADNAVSQDRWYYNTAEDILVGYGDFRFGSVISIHSKLSVCRFPRDELHFRFDANADPHEVAYAERTVGVTPESINSSFQDSITAFLGELGIARTVDCSLHSR